ncbi:sugar phosphate isomerase/epimerase family protein [Methylobacterium indicum]|uniref:sugar phosphate isomerase/epimerase family protein n=1 Tax=Methylobacterium indicum TaxID=1775910 RepID=UPI00243584B3|nr:sugar phosphate isomerase/epimerase [Methylobacterium indicum]
MTFKSSISNIAWPSSSREHIYGLLSRSGVAGIEMAPTKIRPWDDLTPADLATERQLLASCGLVVSSYQAIFFGLPELQLLGDGDSFERMRRHTVRVAQIAEQLSGGGVGVFGAPRNRQRGALTEREAFDLGTERFSLLAEDIAPYSFALSLEPAPAEYGGNFLQTTTDCARMVRKVGRQNFRLHLDTGCLKLSGEDTLTVIQKYADLIGHVHLSQPNLAPIQTTEKRFADLTSGLKSIKYSAWLAIEMREAPDPEQAIRQAIAVLSDCQI